MILAKPAPFVSAFIDAVDQAIRQAHPNSGMSATQRAWLAFCVTATLRARSHISGQDSNRATCEVAICFNRFQRPAL
jgi:hypothetical protein